MKTPVLLWVNHFAVLPTEGGGTRHFEIGRELVRRGWQVSIAASDFNLHSRSYSRRRAAADRAAVRETADGVEFAWLWSSPYRGNDWRRLRNWLSFGQSLLRLQPSRRPDIIIGSSPHLFAALAAEVLARRWRVPFVLEVRDLWPESLVAAGGRKGVAYYALAVLARYLYRRADRIVMLSRGAASQVERLGVDPQLIVHVPNGVDLSEFDVPNVPTRGELRFLYSGAHGPANGLDVLLDAAELLRDDSRIRIILVGDGSAKEQLVRTATERDLSNIEFRASVPKREMPALMAGAQAGLMVLRDAELFSTAVSPNKLFDYFAASLPVVCNVRGEVEQFLREAGSGVQARDASARSLADAIRTMAAATTDERARMGRAGREWVAREHTRPVLAARLDAALRSLID